MEDARPKLSPLGPPLPRGLAGVVMDACPDCCRLAFFLDVVAAISDEGPGMAIGHHVCPEVAAINMANCDCAAVAIDAPGFAGDVAFANQCAQVFGGSPSGGPSIGARLAPLWRVDSPKAIGHPINLERITVNHTGRLSEGGRGSEREGSSGQGGQFHRGWLARDWGNNAATVSRPATINRGALDDTHTGPRWISTI
jgi:hypothetical protein